MTNDNKHTPLFVLVQLSTVATKERIMKDVPEIVNILKKMSKEDIELVFRSSDSLTFGYLLYSTKHPQQVYSALSTSLITTKFDKFFVLEVGGKSSNAEGFTRVANWLQHHQAA